MSFNNNPHHVVTSLCCNLLAILLLFPKSTHAILPTAAIDVLLPDTNSPPITLLASQASFGAVLADYSQRFHSFESGHGHGGGSGGGAARVPGVGVLPAFPPENDPYLCNEAEGWADYRNNNNNDPNNNNNNDANYLSSNNNAYYQSALLVPRGQCSFEHKALSAQRLGASAIIIYGSLSSRYSLNYTNSTEDCQDPSCNDAKTRTDGYYTMERDVIWPGNKYDYDCIYGRAYIPKEEVEGKLDFVTLPGGYDERNDGFLVGRGESNMCVRYDAALESSSTTSTNGKQIPFVKGCQSQRCLVTGKNITDDNGDNLRYEACCAWDLHIWLYSDNSIPRTEETVTIPAVYITMEESAALLDMVRGANDSESGDPVVLTIYERYRPEYNVSAVLIWALGVFVAWIASYHSSVEYRRLGKALMMKREMNARMQRMSDGGGDDRSQESGSSGRGGGAGGAGRRGRSRSPPSSTTASAVPPSNFHDRPAAEMGRSGSNVSAAERGGEERTIYRAESSSSSQPVYEDPDSLELTASHAVGFIVMASTSLLVLFFFKIYNVVKIMYAFGCSGALAQIIVHPAFVHVFQRFKCETPLRNIEWMSEEDATRAALRGGCKGHCLICLWQLIGPIAPVDVASMIISYGVGATWLYVAFMVPHPDTVPFYWIVQDVFGLCMCILFLQTIKLNAVKVGATLLIVAFFYDIFFVFVTPLLTKHGESIMVNVATSGGPPKADPAWCEKYPWDANCRGGDPLPMLFAIPRIGDYQGGSSLLGLGDIVLPGLLLSFASRFDEAKRLIGVVSGGSGRMRNNGCPDGVGSKASSPFCFLCFCCRGQYFGPVMVAYAVGLLMANAAVYIMEMGQPALLYLVPCCLGTLVYMGHKAGELKDLWEGPRIIRSADALLFGDMSIVCGEDDDEDDVRRREIDDRSHGSGMSNEEDSRGGRMQMT